MDANKTVVASFSSETLPQNGWWWNSQESGRGFTLEIRDGRLFMAAFLYDPSGRPTWITTGGAMSSATSYQGSLVAYANGQTLTGPYQPPVQTGSVGSVDLQFLSPDRAVMTWPGGTMQIERFPFGSGPRTTGITPESGWWWNPAESGRGFALEAQGDTLFIAGYLYDEAGNPVWLNTYGTLDASNRLVSSWMEFRDGQTLTGPYVPPTLTNPNVGPVTVQFLSSTSAVMTLPDDRKISLSRFLF